MVAIMHLSISCPGVGKGWAVGQGGDFEVTFYQMVMICIRKWHGHTRILIYIHLQQFTVGLIHSSSQNILVNIFINISCPILGILISSFMPQDMDFNKRFLLKFTPPPILAPLHGKNVSSWSIILTDAFITEPCRSIYMVFLRKNIL